MLNAVPAGAPVRPAAAGVAMSRYLPAGSLRAPIRPLKRKLLRAARPDRAKAPRTATSRVHLREWRLRELIATQRPPLPVRPGRSLAAVNVTVAAWLSTKPTFAPVPLLAPDALGPLAAARND